MIHLSALLGLSVLLGGVTGCQSIKPSDDERGGDGVIHIKQHPKSKLVRRGSETRFEVMDSIHSSQRVTYRWFFNGNLIDREAAKLLGLSDIDKPVLHVKEVGPANVGFYSALIETRNKKNLISSTHSGMAELMMFTGGNSPTVVYGTPIAGPDGSGTSCPGPYVGYVCYTNASSPTGGWYFRNGGKAYDANPERNTVVRYFGVPYTNSACNTNVPASAYYPYRFTIYFRSNLPTGAYPITLDPR